MKEDLKTTSFDHLLDIHIGKIGTPRRDAFENDVRADSLGLAIRQVRRKLCLTQEQLGELVGVQKAQISKIENSTKDARLGTLLRVFNALGVKVTFDVQMSPEIEMDSATAETAYILSTSANRKSLRKSIEQARNGETIPFDIDESP